MDIKGAMIHSQVAELVYAVVLGTTPSQGCRFESCPDYRGEYNLKQPQMVNHLILFRNKDVRPPVKMLRLTVGERPVYSQVAEK